MRYYLNRGLILEQAIKAAIIEYFNNLHLSNMYPNFNVAVTNEHPFAKLLLNDNLNASDSFPCVVVSTQEDRKVDDLVSLAVDFRAVGIDSDDFDEITKTDENGKEIEGLCTVADEETLEAIKATIEKQGACYGYCLRIRRKDTLGIEIWAENEQLKNELYEQLRLFVAGNLSRVLDERFGFFDIELLDHTVVGHRSNNHNYDFGIDLTGAHISLDIDYCIEQLVLDTQYTEINEIETEAHNYVKEK